MKTSITKNEYLERIPANFQNLKQFAEFLKHNKFYMESVANRKTPEFLAFKIDGPEIFITTNIVKGETLFGEGLVNYRLVESDFDENVLKQKEEKLLSTIKEYGYDSELIIKGHDNFDFFIFKTESEKFDEKSLYKVLQLLKEYNESMLVQDSLQ